MATTEFSFVAHRPHNSRRIPDSLWEKFRGEIIKQYLDQPLKDVIIYMEEVFTFKATKRQYVHRLGVWGVRKYGKPARDESIEASEPPPLGNVSGQPPPHDEPMKDAGGDSAEELEGVQVGSLSRPGPRNHRSRYARRVSLGPVPAAPDAVRVYRPRPRRTTVFQPDSKYRERIKLYQADLVYAAGDRACAFEVYRSMHDRHWNPDPSKLNPFVISRLAISCVISVSTSEEAREASKILDKSTEWLQFPGMPQHASIAAPVSQQALPEHFLVNLLSAHVWDGKQGEDIPLLQIGSIVDSLVSENGVLKELPRRRPKVHVDFLVLELLHYALERVREDGLHDHVEVKDILDQFVKQQLRDTPQRPAAAASKCPKDCLLWIIGLLEPKLRGAPTPPWMTCDDVDPALQLCCYLWHHMFTDSSLELGWVGAVEHQLGMSPTQILYIIATMLIAGVCHADRREKYPTPLLDRDNLQAMLCKEAHLLAQKHDPEFLELFVHETCRLNPLLPGSTSTPDHSRARQYVHSFLADLNQSLPLLQEQGDVGVPEVPFRVSRRRRWP